MATSTNAGFQLATGATDNYVIGGGTLYFYPISLLNPLTSFPTDEEIEQDCYNVGVCSDGFKIKDKPKVEEITDSNGNIIRQYITQDKLTLSTGFVSWNLQNFQTLSTATYSQVANDGSNATFGAQAGDKMVVMTGSGVLPIYLVRLVNDSLPYGQVIRFTTFAQPSAGFDLNFNSKPLSVNAEMTTIYYVKGFMASLRQSIGTTGSVTGTSSSSQPVTPVSSNSSTSSTASSTESNVSTSSQSSTQSTSTTNSTVSTATTEAIKSSLSDNNYKGTFVATHIGGANNG